MHGSHATRPRLFATLAFATIVALAVTALPAEAAKHAQKQRNPNVRNLAVRVEATKLGRMVPQSFPGFSVEYPDVLDYTGSASAPNQAFVNLVSTLGSFGNGAPTIRVGGHSTDQSWWNPDHQRRPATVVTDISHGWLNAVGGFVSRTRTPIVLGLNLGLNDPSNALAFGSAALATLPASTLAAFEIGNEPDLFARPRTFHVGRHLQRRQRQRPSYDFNGYVNDLGNYLGTLAPLGSPLSGGGFAGRGWSSKIGELIGRTRGRMQQYSVHSYPLQTCGHARNRPASELIHRLLHRRGGIERIGRLATIAAKHGVPLRVSETNSAICGGVGRVSNTFAAALWGTDALFGYLKAGVAGVNFHTWTGAWYAPVEFHVRNGRTVAFVRPLFYGMLLFAKATANQARLARTHWHGHGAVRVWSAREANGKLHVVLLNVDRKIKRKVRLRVQGMGGSATVERLTAPSLGARHGVHLSGRSYGRQSSGTMRGRFARARAHPSRGLYTLNLPPASGAMVTIGG